MPIQPGRVYQGDVTMKLCHNTGICENGPNAHKKMEMLQNEPFPIGFLEVLC